MSRGKGSRDVLLDSYNDPQKLQKELFFSCCDRQGTRKEFANYVWTFCIEPLAKYSFSVIHAVVYSIVAVQEMNLAMFFPRLYWQCACLCVNAGNSDTNFEDEDSEDHR